MVMRIEIVGRSSSHFTRVAQIVAHELDVPFALVPIYDMTGEDPATYGDNPALKLPTLRVGAERVFGTENICRRLAELAVGDKRIVWPEEARSTLARNAEELAWHGMTAQVQIAFGTEVAKLPRDNLYFVKARAGLAGSLRWLDEHLDEVIAALPAPRDLSLFEVVLFCLLEHITFRRTMPLDAYPSLVGFARAFAARPSAATTPYHFDRAPTG